MNKNTTIYSSRMKMADLLASDMSLLSILQRLDIKLGFGEATVAEVCREYGISTDLFLIIHFYESGRKRENISRQRSRKPPSTLRVLKKRWRAFPQRLTEKVLRCSI